MYKFRSLVQEGHYQLPRKHRIDYGYREKVRVDGAVQPRVKTEESNHFPV